MTHPVIHLRDVSFRYPGSDRDALVNVDVEISPGELVLVAGDTGSGKSTLLRAMNGLVPHFTGGRFSGTALLAGRSTLDHPPRELSDVAAFVPQDPGASFVVDRVEDELAYAMENLAVPQDSMRRRVEEVLDLLDIAHLRDRSVRALSGGERQRVAIAAALTPGAKVLLLDEPTSQLDPQGAEDVLNALQRLVHEMGFTVVLAEHRLERVAGHADRALGCIAGRVIAGATASVLSELRSGPPVTKLGRALGWDPIPLTVREARSRASALSLPEPTVAVPSSSEISIQLRAVTATYDEHVALRSAALEVRRGEVVAVVGRNGAGKSTLLRVIAGLHAPASGSVEVGGAGPVPGRSVALCPQAPEDILFSDSVTNEVSATLRASGSRHDAIRYLDDLGMAGFADRHPRDLSSGQRSLVAIAAVAATEAPVLLLDEPTRGLDPETKEMLGALLGRWSAEGRTLMFASHDVEMTAEMATRVVMLAAGEIVSDGSVADVLSDSQVFSPQMTRVFGRGWLTVRQVQAALGRT